MSQRKKAPAEQSKQKFKYIKDEPDYRHLEDRDLYRKMYNEVGTVDANKVVKWRQEWMSPFHPKKNSSILELGAHNGPNLIYYGRDGHAVDGVEISDTLIETFHINVKKEPQEVQDRVNMIQAWIEEFDTDKTYDYVLCTEILEHVVDPVEILKVARKFVKDDGEVYISSPTTLWGNNTHVRGVPTDDLEKWLKESKLEPTKIYSEKNRTFCYARKK